MLDFAMLEIDPVLAEQGAWLDMGKGARVKIARQSSSKFRKCVQRLLAENSHRAIDGKMPEDVSEEITARAIAEAIVLDWEGFTMHGEPFPYSVENALTIVRNPLMTEVRERWLTFSIDADNYREARLESDAKK